MYHYLFKTLIAVFVLISAPLWAASSSGNESAVSANASAESPSDVSATSANVSATSANVSKPTSANQVETIKNSCVDEWVKLGKDTSDKDAYKAFGVKYCSCASSQPLEGDDAIKKAARLCMTQTLLKDVMDNLNTANNGLKNVSSDMIKTGCLNKLNIIYPKMDPDAKKSTTAYCDCASPKLADLVKGGTGVSDPTWDNKVNEIASNCSG